MQKRGHYKKVQLEIASVLLCQGMGVRQVAKEAALCKETVCQLRRRILLQVLLKCPCGRDAGHNGWCLYRYQQSFKRQKWMREVFRRPAKPRLEATCFLGLLSGVSSRSVVSQRCKIKGCAFPATKDNLCQQHMQFFACPISMTDSALDWMDVHDSESQESVLSVIKPWDNQICFEHRGKRTRDKFD